MCVCLCVLSGVWLSVMSWLSIRALLSMEQPQARILRSSVSPSVSSWPRDGNLSSCVFYVSRRIFTLRSHIYNSVTFSMFRAVELSPHLICEYFHHLKRDPLPFSRYSYSWWRTLIPGALHTPGGTWSIPSSPVSLFGCHIRPAEGSSYREDTSTGKMALGLPLYFGIEAGDRWSYQEHAERFLIALIYDKKDFSFQWGEGRLIRWPWDS